MSKDTLTMLVLIAAVTTLAVVAVSLERATWLEGVSFVTGAICVWLVVKESPWNFPIAMINVASFSVVFYQQQLYAAAGLQLVYFVLSGIGWWMWLFGGHRGEPLRVSRVSFFELALIVALVALSTWGLSHLLHASGGRLHQVDALTTSMSFGSQWLLNRKRLENWIGWIAVDIIYVPFYLASGLRLTAMLYAIYLVMAVMGWREWKRSWQRSTGNVLPAEATT
jgi:nicotinamide mononucleotide transporter